MSHKQKAISKKFGRARDQRNALIKSMADSLILNSSIRTTLPRAKTVVSYTEKLVTKAKRGRNNLHVRRSVIKSLATKEAAYKLVDEIAPALSERNSGYFRIERLGWRRSDDARLAKISFVDDLNTAKKSQKTAKTPTPDHKKTEIKSKTETQPQLSMKDSSGQLTQPKKSEQAPKRAGVRGNR